MEIIILILGITNIVTAVLLAIIFIKSKKIKQRPESLELQEFLIDLLSGDSFIQVKRISPGDVLLRSRRR